MIVVRDLFVLCLDLRNILHVVVSDNKGEKIMTTKFDAIIIGTGQSGPSLASRMASEGMKVAIVERKAFGGTCVNTG